MFQDVESYDPILNPVLNREVRRTGGRVLITLGDQDIDLSPSFVIFLSTRDPTVRRRSVNPLNSQFGGWWSFSAGGVSSRLVLSGYVCELHGDAQQPAEPVSERGAEGRAARRRRETLGSPETAGWAGQKRRHNHKVQRVLLEQHGRHHKNPGTQQQNRENVLETVKAQLASQTTSQALNLSWLLQP